MASRAIKRASKDSQSLSQLAEGNEGTVRGFALTNASNDPHQPSDIFHWRLTVVPPSESVYAGSSYELLLSLSPENYPFSPPEIRVLTPIFNPAVSEDDGQVCAGLLVNDDWRPTKSPEDVVHQVVQGIFVDYARLDPLNPEASRLLSQGDYEVFNKRVKEVNDGAQH